MEDLRKLAADIVGRAALEERFGQRQLSALDAVTLEKIASADTELLKVAASFGSQNILKVYEDLGGQYKTAVTRGAVVKAVRNATASTERLKDFAGKMRAGSDRVDRLRGTLGEGSGALSSANKDSYTGARDRLALVYRGAADHANRRLGVKEADALGKKYGLSQTQIGRIIRGERWKPL